MKPGGGKQKGAAFERFVSERLSLWVSRRKKRDLFWRSAMSGGRATTAKKEGAILEHQAGDICAVHPLGHVLTGQFYIECKFVKDLRLDLFLFGRGALAGYWDVARREADSYMRKPMLIAKQNRGAVLVILRRGALEYLTQRDVPRVQLTWPTKLSMEIIDFDELTSSRFSPKKPLLPAEG